MRLSYDPSSDCCYISFVDEKECPDVKTVEVDLPSYKAAVMFMDWCKETGMLTGIEIVGASALLPAALIELFDPEQYSSYVTELQRAEEEAA